MLCSFSDARQQVEAFTSSTSDQGSMAWFELTNVKLDFKNCRIILAQFRSSILLSIIYLDHSHLDLSRGLLHFATNHTSVLSDYEFFVGLNHANVDCGTFAGDYGSIAVIFCMIQLYSQES